MAVKHYINTEAECISLLERMDSFYGYPKNKTLKTSSIYELENERGSYMAVPTTYTELTETDEAFLVSNRPDELNE